MRTSIRSLAIGLVGLGATAVVRTLVVLRANGSSQPGLASDIGEAVIVLATAAVILLCAYRLPRDRSRLSWLLVGAGTLCFAVGDIVWAIMEIGGLGTPYPGPPDFFYLIDYLLLGTAVLIPAIAMRQHDDVLGASLVASLGGVVGIACLFSALVNPMIARGDMALKEQLMSLVYPAADVCLLLVPAIFVLVVAIRSGDRRQSLPWLYVAAGLLLMAVSDTAFSWMALSGTYVGGAAVDYGWMVAHVSLAVGASVALDASRQLDASVVEAHQKEQTSAATYSLSSTQNEES